MCWLLSVAGRVNKEELRELLPILGLLPRIDFPVVMMGDFFSPIELPMCEVFPTLIRLLEPIDAFFPLPELGTAGFLPR